MPFKRLAAAFALAAGVLTGTVSDTAAEPPRRSTPGAHITTHGTPFIVPGHIGFCRRHADECAPLKGPAMAVKSTTATMRQLDRVNTRVNNRITYLLDELHYGREDYWAYPVNNIGDCEDYALAKRRELIAAGWPPSALLMATAYAENGEGHAVLVARTDKGDFVLDNRHASVMPWRALPYKWVALQNPGNPSAMNPVNNGRGLLDVLGLH
jgi:predicted transglutaminase-like cysteine proteinase